MLARKSFSFFDKLITFKIHTNALDFSRLAVKATFFNYCFHDFCFLLFDTTNVVQNRIRTKKNPEKS